MIPLPSTHHEGVLGGLVFGAFFFVAGVIILVLRWPDMTGGFWSSVLQAAGTYLFGGALGGALLFWLRPLLTRRFGGAIVGSVMFLPVTLLFSFAADGSDDLSLFEGMGIAVFVAILFGAVIGQALLRDGS